MSKTDYTPKVGDRVWSNRMRGVLGEPDYVRGTVIERYEVELAREQKEVWIVKRDDGQVRRYINDRFFFWPLDILDLLADVLDANS